MNNSLKNIIATSLVALATGCSTSQITPNVQYTTKPNHSAIPTGTYATPQNVKGTTLGTLNSKDMKSQFEFTVIDGNILEVRDNPSPYKNELSYTLSYALNGRLDIDTSKKTQELRPLTYFVPTQWMMDNTNDIVRKVTLDPRSFRADVTKLGRIVNESGKENGILKVSDLITFGLQSKKIRNNDYLFLKNGSSGFRDYVMMPAKNLGVIVDLRNGELTLKNEGGLYRLIEYDAKRIEDRKSTNQGTTAVPIRTYGP